LKKISLDPFLSAHELSQPDTSVTTGGWQRLLLAPQANLEGLDFVLMVRLHQQYSLYLDHKFSYVKHSKLPSL
jgi:hypothetical protein